MIAKLLLLAALQAPAPITVTTFNIRYDNPRDGADAWPNRRDDLIAWLRRQSSDIIALQEALRGQLDDLRALGYGEIGVGRDDGATRGEYAAILYRRQRFEALESGTFWFSDTPDVPGSRSWGNNVTRICTWARFRELPSGRHFYVFNVHLDHESQPSRERSVAALLMAIRERRHPADPVIVTGDFNAGPGNPAVRAMAEQFADTYASGDTLEGTFNGFRADSLGAKIDFVFADRAFVVSAARIDRPRTAAGRHLSDHFPVSAALMLPAGETGEPIELAALTVSATRNDRRIEDQALRVEVVEPEEVEEKLAMTPGDISMLLNETGGLRVASTAPSTGGANVRIHGLRGRYTQILADGLPLYGEAGALNILQIPPLDLMQVEIVKGPASAMYGGAALGGLINLVSRRPHERSSEILLNGTTLLGTDVVAFASRPLGGPWGYTLLAGYHRQGRRDVDDDGWANVPGYDRSVIRPRLFYEDGTGRRLFATLGVTTENREGGPLDGSSPDGVPWSEQLRTRRYDAGLSARTASGPWSFTARASGMTVSHRHAFGDREEDDRHANALLEATAGRTSGRLAWLAGAALTYDRFRSDSASRFDYDHAVPALFAQADIELSSRAVMQASARADFNSDYGTQLSPRLSVLYRLASASLRLSAAYGYFAPTPLVEASEAVGLHYLSVPAPLRAEHAGVLSLDLGMPLGPVETNVTVFAARIDDPVIENEDAFATLQWNIFNIERTDAAGVDVVARLLAEPWHVTVSGTYAWVEERSGMFGRREAALNPRATAGAVVAWEQSGWRIGGELYYTGQQRQDSNPWRSVSPGYAIAGLLIQRQLGKATLFVNFENMTDTRMTKTHPLLRQSRSALTGWTTEVWGPLDGRVVNAGVRLRLSGAGS